METEELAPRHPNVVSLFRAWEWLAAAAAVVAHPADQEAPVKSWRCQRTAFEPRKRLGDSGARHDERSVEERRTCDDPSGDTCRAVDMRPSARGLDLRRRIRLGGRGLARAATLPQADNQPREGLLFADRFVWTRHGCGSDRRSSRRCSLDNRAKASRCAWPGTRHRRSRRRNRGQDNGDCRGDTLMSFHAAGLRETALCRHGPRSGGVNRANISLLRDFRNAERHVCRRRYRDAARFPFLNCARFFGERRSALVETIVGDVAGLGHG